MAIDLAQLWDFNDPEVSEQRFRALLPSAAGDDGLVLRIQIARTYGLRTEFARARELLRQMERDVAAAGANVRARHALELGRTFASAAHPRESQDPQAKEEARAQYARAFELARSARLDGLAIDALHMLAFVDTAPADQLRWGREALAIAESSEQPAAKRWEASLRNNIGNALLQLGRHEEALAHLRQALALRERGGDARAIRIAREMVERALLAMNGRSEEPR